MHCLEMFRNVRGDTSSAVLGPAAGRRRMVQTGACWQAERVDMLGPPDDRARWSPSS